MAQIKANKPGTLRDHYRPQARETNAYRGHLPPPFYNGADDKYRPHQQLSEGWLPDRLHEDRANYGRGGYYGHTFDQSAYLQERNRRTDHGHQDNYRELGDHRWDRRPGEIERYSRTGYRPLHDRMEASVNHQGKGPRDYRRSDQRILEDINDRLYDDPYVNATDVEVEVVGGDAVLRGTVESRHAKRRVEDIAESVSGVRNIENLLRIRKEEISPG